jgi:hypothetical protein
MYNAVVTINNTHWPACRNPRHTLVDLRLFDPTDRNSKPRLIFRPDALRKLGIPEKLVEAAAESDPQGFALFEDLPDQTPQVEGCINQLPSDQSTNESEENAKFSSDLSSHNSQYTKPGGAPCADARRKRVT